ncbi:MAG TPA: hypothetical protein VL137_13475 [Polyangiaceae bacterium]|nr:hypothetical protein [Polyangiaceae bacterium]
MHVRRITGGYDGGIKFECGGRYESVYGMFGGHSRLGQESTGSLCDGPSQIHYGDTSVIEKVVDGSIESRPAANFSQDRGWNANEGTVLVGDGQDSHGSVEKNATVIWTREGVKRLGIQDQRFGHARRAAARTALEGAPCFASSSARNAPSCSRSSSWEIA